MKKQMLQSKRISLDNKYVTLREVSQLFKVCVGTVHNWRQSAKLKFPSQMARKGHTKLFLRSEIEDWMKSEAGIIALNGLTRNILDYDQDKYITAHEVGRLLNVSVATVQKWIYIHSHEDRSTVPVPVLYRGKSGSVLFLRADIDAWIKSVNIRPKPDQSGSGLRDYSYLVDLLGK